MRVIRKIAFTDKIILGCIFFCFLIVCLYRNHGNLQGVIWSDTEGYYYYLPAVFIYNDVHAVPERSMNFRRNTKGEIVIKYTCGTAFFYLPFFLAAHAAAQILHYPATGFSTPYYLSMILCGVFWSLIGVYLLQRILSKYFDKTAAWLAVFAVILGTNFFYYATKWVGMSHLYSFVLIAALLLLFDHFYEKPQNKTAIVIGFLFGLLVLIRPTNCIAILFYFLYKVSTKSEFKNRIHFLIENWRTIVLAIPFFFVPFIPQLLYWKEMTGSWVSYSYDGESFTYWKQPKIAAVLFDTQNGLFIYAPILAFMFFGLLIGHKDRRTNFWGVATTFLVITYVFASWWAWWFGAAYGHRCYIDYFPLFAFPIAFAFEKIRQLKTIYRNGIYLIAALLVYYNISMTFVSDRCNCIWDGEQWRWNWQLWWQTAKDIFP